MRRLLPLLLLGLAGPLPAAEFALQLPGGFHGDETIARDGELWLALQLRGAHAELVSSRVTVTQFEDAVLDTAGERSGRMVSASDADSEPVALLHGSSLVAGAVAAAAQTDIALMIDETVCCMWGSCRARAAHRLRGTRTAAG